jgi:hypothetical protein
VGTERDPEGDAESTAHDDTVCTIGRKFPPLPGSKVPRRGGDRRRHVYAGEASARGTPGNSEVGTIVDVDVSCHARGPCLGVQLDCSGPECVKSEPMKSCKKKSPGCGGTGFCK